MAHQELLTVWGSEEIIVVDDCCHSYCSAVVEKKTPQKTFLKKLDVVKLRYDHCILVDMDTSLFSHLSST